MAYDVVVIGSGPAGYVCAIKSAQLGLHTALVEKSPNFGGTCINVGCIPSKALLHASETFVAIGHDAAKLGIKVPAPELDLTAMLAHKSDTVAANVKGLDFLMKKNKVEIHRGTGKVLGAGKVAVTADDGSVSEIETKNIVIATGSAVAGIPGMDVEFDEKVIVSSTGALSLEKVPGTMVVVGGGVIGLELGSVWSRLGASVTVVEYLDNLLGGMDGEVTKTFQRLITRQGIAVKTGSRVTSVERKGDSASVTFEPVKGGDAVTIDADVVLISTGRVPYTAGLGLAEAGVVLDERGRVQTDGHYKTNIDGIYAIGDVIIGPMLAHKGEDEGVAVAEILAGQKGHVNYGVIPSVVYTQPEVASVGKTEEELKKEGVAYKIGKFPFMANGRARAMLQTDGFVKILADAETDKVLGAHILGFGAGEMIHEVAVLMEFGGSAEDLARTCHAHPTMSESIREAALGAFAKTIHS